jgi:hypothetical protein
MIFDWRRKVKGLKPSFDIIQALSLFEDADKILGTGNGLIALIFSLH